MTEHTDSEKSLEELVEEDAEKMTALIAWMRHEYAMRELERLDSLIVNDKEHDE